MSKHILSVLVDNHPGVVSRVSGLFSRRGFNMHSLVGGITENSEISRITIVVDGDDYTVDQVSKQLNKLIDVITVKKLDSDSSVARELLLIKVQGNQKDRAEIIQLAEIFRGKIVDVSNSSFVIELSGPQAKIDAFIDLVKPFGIKEIVRTGTIAIDRGENCIKVNKELCQK